MLAVIYLVLALLLVVLLIVRLLYRLLVRDTIEHDMNCLWEQYHISLNDIRFPKRKR